jgi:hypothetical protein
MNDSRISDEIVDDVAERIGRFATEDMLLDFRVPVESGKENYAIAGFLAAATTLHVVREHFDRGEVAAFVDDLRNRLARWEERAA